MKIAIIQNLYPPFARGGAEAVAEEQAEGLKARGHKVLVITTRPRSAARSVSLKKEAVYLPGLFSDLGKLDKASRFFWHISNLAAPINQSRIKKILAEFGADITITHNLMGIGFSVPAVLRSLKIKQIHILHDIQLLHPSGLMYFNKESVVDSASARAYQGAVRRFFGSPACVVSPSRWLLSEHEKRGFFPRSRKTVLFNPATLRIAKSEDNNFPQLLHEEQELRGDRPLKFLYAGLLEEHKGAALLISAFKGMQAAKEGKTELLIAGGGSMLEKFRVSAGERAGIKLLGRIPRAQVASLLERSDCLVMPSICYENFPAIILEAFAAGVPVIASRIGGIPEIVNERNGFLFSPGDKDELIAKLEQAIADRSSLARMRIQAKTDVEKYSLDKYLDLLEDLF
jgi:glycosyltransferase involved in cell wall biosynthesis